MVKINICQELSFLLPYDPNDKNNKIKIQCFIIIVIILFQSMDKEGFSPNRDRKRDYLMIRIFIVSLLRIPI